MVEDGTTDATATVEAQPTPLVSADGALREDWRNSVPEDIRTDQVFDRVSNFEGIMKTLSSGARAYGKDKIAIPTEASSEAEWGEWHKAGGRPETAGDYNFAKPETLPEEFYSKELATAAQELFHNLGLSKKQADALFEFNNNNVIAQLTQNTQDAEIAKKQLTDGLYAKWGNAYEQKKHFGNAAIESGTGGDAEFKARLLEKFGNDPDFIEFSSNCGSKLQETGSIKIESIPTPGDTKTRREEAMAHKSYGIDYAKHGFTRQQHDAQVQKVSLLFTEETKHLKTG